MPLVLIPNPADNALVDPLGLLTHTFSSIILMPLKLTIAEPVPVTPVNINNVSKN